MINAIFAVSRIPEWKDVSLRLRDQFYINPVYWISSSSYRSEIEATYPGIIYHETNDANRAIYSKELPIRNCLSKRVIIEHSETEREFYIMLNRHDLHGSFSYEERKRLYYSQLNYWLNVIDHCKIELLVLPETPHALAEFVIYALCKKLGIQTIMLSLTTIPGTLYAKESFPDVPTIPIVVKDNEKLDQVMSINIKKMRCTEEKPWYMTEQQKRFARAGLFMRLRALRFSIPFLLEKLCLLQKKPYNEFYKRRNFLFEDSYFTRSEFIFQRVNLRSRQLKLRKTYRSFSEIPDLKKRYLYFPLHFQPERSSCPEGSVFADQQVVIQMIADKLPDDTFLYVKEHPSQFMMTRGALGRTCFYYDDIKKIPNVVLVDDTFSSRQLIMNSLSIVTLTGTAGMEALLCGKPALVFGYAWYRKLPGVFSIEEPEHLKNALEKIMNGYLVSIDELLERLEEQKKYLVAGYVTRWSMNSISISYEENVNALYKGYASLLSHLGYKENSNK